MKKGVEVVLDHACEDAFESIKKKNLTKLYVLVAPMSG